MKVEDLVVVSSRIIDKETIVFTEKTRKFCLLPYPDHKNGCPNYGKNDLCPPKTPYRKDVLKKYDDFILVHAEFDFKAYVEGMREIHPDWTGKQLRNVLYWQSQVKKLLKDYITKKHKGWYNEMFGAGSGFWGYPSMEAAGIYVMGTLKNNGIDFEVKPVNKVMMVSLLMRKKKGGGLLDFV